MHQRMDGQRLQSKDMQLRSGLSGLNHLTRFASIYFTVFSDRATNVSLFVLSASVVDVLCWLSYRSFTFYVFLFLQMLV
jgi:hypothetical protein